MPSTDPPATIRSSRWWYLIAIIPIIELLMASIAGATFFLVFALDQTQILGFNETTIAMAMVLLSIVVFLVMILLPYAVYRDLELLEEYVTLTQWRFDRHQFLIGAVAGVFLPILGFGVALYYLYQRHHHVGIP
ncbi:hypothetical protein [Haladaptatus sp. DYF46]|uniref:hypothetical protein n=1 Tax=Haladaptatus sp. DYF46 TaxID=2886041 RepID=UPI001E3316DC|nr:hypothetical protein [Haladaptatus sp. DYF46]